MQKEKQSNYRQHKAIFESIKQQDRPAWLRSMLQTPQKTGPYPLHRKDYPTHNKWTYNNCELHYYSHLNPIQPAKALLFYFPGLNAHANGSAFFAMGIAESCSVDCYALDYENFGRSAGEDRGVLRDAEQVVRQAEAFVEFIVGGLKEKKKVYISGLSLGGAVCFKLAIRHPERYNGVIFLSPALKQNKQAQPFMKKIGKLIGSWFPTAKLVNQTFTSMTKYDQTQRILDDPYIYKGKVIPGTIKVVLDLMEQIQGEWSKFTTPFLLIQSGVDKMVDPFLGVDFQRACKAEDKTVVYFKDMWHAVFAEDQMPEVVEVATEWMAARVNK